MLTHCFAGRIAPASQSRWCRSSRPGPAASSRNYALNDSMPWRLRVDLEMSSSVSTPGAQVVTFTRPGIRRVWSVAEYLAAMNRRDLRIAGRLRTTPVSARPDQRMRGVLLG